MKFLTGGQLVTVITQLEVERVNPDTRSSAIVALPNSINSLLCLVSASSQRHWTWGDVTLPLSR